MSIELTSPAFTPGETIPRDYTADGRNASPPLKWSDPPADAKSFALLCEDPDAPRGTFVHWVAANLPSESRDLSEGVPKEASLPNGTVQGVNGFGKVGFGGPAPPPGKPHHYHFKLYALDAPLDLKGEVTATDLKSAMHGHVLAESELVGLYQR